MSIRTALYRLAGTALRPVNALLARLGADAVVIACACRHFFS